MENGLALDKVYSHPEFKDLEEENNRMRQELSQSQLAKINLQNANTVKLPHIMKNQLVMQDGRHNGLIYTKEELVNELDFSDSAGSFNLVMDHMDTREDAGVSNYAGTVINRHWDDNGAKGPGIYADLKIMSEDIAKQLILGAKFGISPTFDFDPGELNGEEIATNLTTRSYSFVLDPAVRKTMLNQKNHNNGGASNMSPNNNLPSQNGNAQTVQDATLAYKYPFKDNEKLNSELDVSEPTMEVLKHMESRIKELSEFKEKIEKSELANQADIILSNEFLMGRIDLEELDARKAALAEKSNEVLSEVGEILGTHELLQDFTEFTDAFKKQNPNATLGQIGGAWREKLKELAENDEDGETQDDPKAGEDTPADGKTPPTKTGQSLLRNSGAGNPTQSELSRSTGDVTNNDVAMAGFLHEDRVARGRLTR